MFGGFRERAEYTYRLLRAPGTAFLVVAAPEPTRCGRRRTSWSGSTRERHAAGRAGPEPGAPLAARPGCRRRAAWPPPRRCRGWTTSESAALGITALRLHAERMRQAERSAGWPSASPPRTRSSRSPQIPAQADDVHDLDGLRAIGQAFGG